MKRTFWPHSHFFYCFWFVIFSSLSDPDIHLFQHSFLSLPVKLPPTWKCKLPNGRVQFFLPRMQYNHTLRFSTVFSFWLLAITTVLYASRQPISPVLYASRQPISHVDGRHAQLFIFLKSWKPERIWTFHTIPGPFNFICSFATQALTSEELWCGFPSPSYT